MPIDLKELEGKAFTPEEAAEKAGINPDTMRRLCRTGKIKAAKPPGSKTYYIPGHNLIRYILGEPPDALGDNLIRDILKPLRVKGGE